MELLLDKSRVFVTNDGVDPVLGHLLATKLTPDYDCENKMPYYNGTSGTGLEVSYSAFGKMVVEGPF